VPLVAGGQQVIPVHCIQEVVKAATPPLITCISILERLEIDCLLSFNFLVDCFGFIIVI